MSPLLENRIPFRASGSHNSRAPSGPTLYGRLVSYGGLFAAGCFTDFLREHRGDPIAVVGEDGLAVAVAEIKPGFERDTNYIMDSTSGLVGKLHLMGGVRTIETLVRCSLLETQSVGILVTPSIKSENEKGQITEAGILEIRLCSSGHGTGQVRALDGVGWIYHAVAARKEAFDPRIAARVRIAELDMSFRQNMNGLDRIINTLERRAAS